MGMVCGYTGGTLIVMGIGFVIAAMFSAMDREESSKSYRCKSSWNKRYGVLLAMGALRFVKSFAILALGLASHRSRAKTWLISSRYISSSTLR